MASDLPGFRQLSYLAPTEATRPRDGVTVWVDRWWVGDPQRGRVCCGTDRTPQCNTNYKLAEGLRAFLYPDAQLWFVPLVFMPPVRDRAWIAGGDLWPALAVTNGVRRSS